MVNRTYGSIYGPTYYDDTSQRSRSLFWARIVLGCMLVLVFIPAIISSIRYENQMDAAREALVPTLTEPQYVAFMNKVAAEIDEPAGSIDRYFTILRDVDSVEPIVQKFSHSATRPILEPMRVIQPAYAMNELMTKYTARYGVGAMQQAAASKSAELNPFGKPREVPSNAGMLFLYGWLLSLGVAAAFLSVRVMMLGMNWWVELDKIVAYSLIWPVMVFKYPTHVDVVAQTKRAMARMGWVLTALLSLGSAGGAFAKANQRTSYESDYADAANTYVLDEIPLPKLTLTAGIETGKIVGNGKAVQQNPVAFQDANAVWKNGWSFDYWASESIGAPGTSDERDFTLTKSWKLPENRSLITGIALFDIQPIASTKGGDVLSPFAEYDVPLGHGLTGFVRGDAYFLTGGPSGRDGFLGRVGLRTSSIQLPAGFTLSATGTMLYSKGPFRMDAGVSSRLDLSLKHAITDRLSFGLGATGFVPLAGTKERHPDHSLSATLTYAVN